MTSTREVVLSTLNASSVPLHRDEIVQTIHEEYDHDVHPGTIYKWLYTLSRQQRIIKLAPGFYASVEAAEHYREEESIG